MAVFDTFLSRANTATVVGQGWAREVVAAPFNVAFTTGMLDNTNDNVGLLWVPNGAVITGIIAKASDMDTNGTPLLAFDIGDASVQNRLVAASQIGRAGTSVQTLADTGVLYKYTAQTQIRCYIQAAAATAAAGTLQGAIMYFVDENYNTTALTAS